MDGTTLITETTEVVMDGPLYSVIQDQEEVEQSGNVSPKKRSFDTNSEEHCDVPRKITKSDGNDSDWIEEYTSLPYSLIGNKNKGLVILEDLKKEKIPCHVLVTFISQSTSVISISSVIQYFIPYDKIEKEHMDMLLAANKYIHTCEEYPDDMDECDLKRLKNAFGESQLQTILYRKYMEYRCDLTCKGNSIVSTHGDVLHITTGVVND